MTKLKKGEAVDVEDKQMHFKWLVNHIAESKEEAEWVTNGNSITKASLNFTAKS